MLPSFPLQNACNSGLAGALPFTVAGQRWTFTNFPFTLFARLAKRPLFDMKLFFSIILYFWKRMYHTFNRKPVNENNRLIKYRHNLRFLILIQYQFSQFFYC